MLYTKIFSFFCALCEYPQRTLRSDIGKLFKNFVFLELSAEDVYKMHRFHFWRTTNQTEIDFIKEDGLKVEAIEAKYDSEKKPKAFQTFKKYYPESECKVITAKDFIGVGSEKITLLKKQKDSK